jgi:hypothetical protein
MSSSFESVEAVAVWVAVTDGMGAGASPWLAQLRHAKRPTAPPTMRSATTAYFALPESGTPAGRRLEGGIEEGELILKSPALS